MWANSCSRSRVSLRRLSRKAISRRHPENTPATTAARSDETGPEPQRLPADDPAVDSFAGEAWHRHLAGAPEQTDHHARQQASALLAQQPSQQRPSRRRCGRLLFRRWRRRRRAGCSIHGGRLYA